MKGLISLIIREMETIITVRDHSAPIRMAKIKNLIITWNKWNSCVLLIGMHGFAATLENSLEGFFQSYTYAYCMLTERPIWSTIGPLSPMKLRVGGGVADAWSV